MHLWLTKTTKGFPDVCCLIIYVGGYSAVRSYIFYEVKLKTVRMSRIQLIESIKTKLKRNSDDITDERPQSLKNNYNLSKSSLKNTV